MREQTIIFGGGIPRLTIAFELKKQGVNALILEPPFDRVVWISVTQRPVSASNTQTISHEKSVFIIRHFNHAPVPEPRTG